MPYVPTTFEDGTKVYNETITDEGKDLTDIFAQAKEEDGVVEIAADDLVITFDSSAVSAIGGSEVVIAARVVVEAPEIEEAELVLEVTLSGATFADGSATVCVPFEKEVPPSKIAKVYYVDDDGNKTDMNAVFADGKVTFTTNHFSTYAVIFEDVINTVSPEKSGLSGGAIAGIIVGSVVGAALIAFGIVLLIRKKRSPKKETEEEEVKE